MLTGVKIFPKAERGGVKNFPTQDDFPTFCFCPQHLSLSLRRRRRFLSAAAMLSTRLASVSLSAAGDAAPSFLSLPRPLLFLILQLVPVETRLRCSEVSRAWRALLADTVFWECLGFNDLTRARFSEALFVAAVAKAGGQLRELDVRGKFACHQPLLTQAPLMAAVAANSRTLQRLRLCSCLDGLVPRNRVEALCVAAPGLQTLEANVSCSLAEARALLRREPPFGALNMRSFQVDFTSQEATSFLSCMADLQPRASLKTMHLRSAPMPSRVAWEALADTAMSLSLKQVYVSATLIGLWCVPSLARLLREGTLLRLSVGSCPHGGEIFDAETEPIVSAALRANSTLQYIRLSDVGLWNQRAGIDFVNALAGHPTLKMISLNQKIGDDAEMRDLAGAALGRLVAANTPALKLLDVHGYALSDDGLRPLFAALPFNAHLSRLIAERNGISAAFAPVVLASVRANQSLVHLSINGTMHTNDEFGYGGLSIAELREVEALVARR